jgi:hypothetical protein
MTRSGNSLSVILAMVALSILGWNIFSIKNTGSTFFNLYVVALATMLLLILGMFYKVKPWIYVLILLISVLSSGMLPQR